MPSPAPGIPGLQLLDSIAYVARPGHGIAAAVIVSGSHAGESAARFVIEHPERPLIVFFNDAGIGKEQAGIAGLAALDATGIAAAAYSHESARIGDARDGFASGVLSRVNLAAAALGTAPGETVAAAVARLGALVGGAPPAKPPVAAARRNAGRARNGCPPTRTG